MFRSSRDVGTHAHLGAHVMFHTEGGGARACLGAHVMLHMEGGGAREHLNGYPPGGIESF
jgi:hypothetical protein